MMGAPMLVQAEAVRGSGVWLVLLPALLAGTGVLLYVFRRRLFLSRALCGQGEGLPEAPARKDMVGSTGTVVVTLRPTGTVRVGEELVPAVAETGWIDRGATVRVLRASAMEIIVRQVEAEGA